MTTFARFVKTICVIVPSDKLLELISDYTLVDSLAALDRQEIAVGAFPFVKAIHLIN